MYPLVENPTKKAKNPCFILIATLSILSLCCPSLDLVLVLVKFAKVRRFSFGQNDSVVALHIASEDTGQNNPSAPTSFQTFQDFKLSC